LEKTLVVNHKGLGPKMKWLAVNRQSWSNFDSDSDGQEPRVEVGSNISTVSLGVVGGDNWATLFLGDINTLTWPSRSEESRIWDSKIWSWIPRVSDPRMTALARASKNCKRQIHPHVREGAPYQQIRKCLEVITFWSWAAMGAWHQERLAEWPLVVI
jgi:hypothetical protein